MTTSSLYAFIAVPPSSGIVLTHTNPKAATKPRPGIDRLNGWDWSLETWANQRLRPLTLVLLFAAVSVGPGAWLREEGPPGASWGFSAAFEWLRDHCVPALTLQHNTSSLPRCV